MSDQLTPTARSGSRLQSQVIPDEVETDQPAFTPPIISSLGVVVFIWLFCVTAKLMAGECELPKSTNLNVKLIGQEAGNWCWAASTQMVMDFLKVTNASQCRQAIIYFTNSVCCTNANECDDVGWPQFWNYNIEASVLTQGQFFTWADIKTNIACKRQPFLWATLPTNQCRGHILVVVGYEESEAGTKKLIVYDSEPMNTGAVGAVTYDHYERLGTEHWRHYYDFRTGETHATQIPVPTCRARLPVSGIGDLRLIGTLSAREHLAAALEQTRAYSLCLETAATGNYKLLGFDSIPQRRDLTNGVAFEVVSLNYDALRGYQPTGNVGRVLTRLNSVIVPVIVSNQVRSSITLTKRSRQWEVDRLSDANLVRLLVDTRRNSERSNHVPADKHFAVRMPVGRNPYMIAHVSQNALMITPILDDPKYDLQAGRTVAATNLFHCFAVSWKEGVGIR